MGIDKVVGGAAEAVADVADGAVLAVGGFGACGTPVTLAEALLAVEARGMHLVSNNCGTDDHGLGRLLAAGRLASVTASYVGDNAVLAQMYARGELDLDLVPQGTLAERLRAGGAGIPAFFTAAGVGTPVAEGGLPVRYGTDGTVAVASQPRRTEQFDGRSYVLERAVRADVGLVHAAKADPSGNLVFRRSARNLNPLVATASHMTVVEAEEIVASGSLDPDEIHLPGVFVQRIVALPAGTPKHIDRRTVRQRPGHDQPALQNGSHQ